MEHHVLMGKVSKTILFFFVCIVPSIVVFQLVKKYKYDELPAEGTFRISFFDRAMDYQGIRKVPSRTLTKEESDQLRLAFQKLTPEYRFYYKDLPDYYTIHATSPKGRGKTYTVFLTKGYIFPDDFTGALYADMMSGAICYRMTDEAREILKKIVWEQPCEEWKLGMEFGSWTEGVIRLHPELLD